jgi:hypothetical protein
MWYNKSILKLPPKLKNININFNQIAPDKLCFTKKQKLQPTVLSLESIR